MVTTPDSELGIETGIGRAEIRFWNTTRKMALTAKLARQDNIAVLFTEHDMDVVFAQADRIIVLNRGKLIAEGSPVEVRANPEVQAVYLGRQGPPVVNPEHRQAQAAGNCQRVRAPRQPDSQVIGGPQRGKVELHAGVGHAGRSVRIYF